MLADLCITTPGSQVRLLLRGGPRLATWVFPPRLTTTTKVKVIVFGVEPQQRTETEPIPPPWKRRALMRKAAVPPEPESPSSSGAQ